MDRFDYSLMVMTETFLRAIAFKKRKKNIERIHIFAESLCFKFSNYSLYNYISFN